MRCLVLNWSSEVSQPILQSWQFTWTYGFRSVVFGETGEAHRWDSKSAASDTDSKAAGFPGMPLTVLWGLLALQSNSAHRAQSVLTGSTDRQQQGERSCSRTAQSGTQSGSVTVMVVVKSFFPLLEKTMKKKKKKKSSAFETFLPQDTRHCLSVTARQHSTEYYCAAILLQLVAKSDYVLY